MLFHVTLRHEAAHCPGYHPEVMARMVERVDKFEAAAGSFGIQVHGFYSALPDHVDYLVAEAESSAALARYLSEVLPYEVDTVTHSVTPLDQLLNMVREMAVV